MHPDYGYFEETQLGKRYDVKLLKRLYPYLDLSKGTTYLKTFFGVELGKPDSPFFATLSKRTARP